MARKDRPSKVLKIIDVDAPQEPEVIGIDEATAKRELLRWQDSIRRLALVAHDAPEKIAEQVAKLLHQMGTEYPEYVRKIITRIEPERKVNQEEKTSPAPREIGYTGGASSSQAAITPQLRMEDKETIDTFAARKGLTVAQLEEAADNWIAAHGEVTARATTGRATATPRPDWIEAHKQGVEVPEFVEKTFAAELADRTMHKSMFDQYQNLRRDFHAYKRHHALPEWLAAVPTKAEWDKLHPPEPLPAEEVRRLEREARRAQRHQRRARGASL